MLRLIFLLSILAIYLGYHYYGKFLDKRFKISSKNKTPAHTQEDGIDYVPTPKLILFGHHFSSIAGAGPVLGPVIASLAFGWLPAVIWVLVGGIFIGGVHDFAALIASVRHQGKSIAEIAHEYMTPRIYKIFLIFIWLSLIYVLIVFIDLTAATFANDGAVATSSLLFILIAVVLGYFLYKIKIKIFTASLIFVPLIFVAIYFGHLVPLNYSNWNLILITYAFIASVLPVWILLQPRDYLSSYLLLASVLIGFLGIVFGNYDIQYPAYISFYSKTQGALFPFLFVIVACGAVSGFHSIVSSGTTAKQISKETHAKPIAYGSMLMETVVAMIAMATVMMITKSGAVGKTPLVVYGQGIARFLSLFGIPIKIGFSFGLLALSTFLLTTLDTATRLARYIFQEFFNMKEGRHRFLATFITLILPIIFSLIILKDTSGNVIPAWKAIWPVFGASNQLLAALTLLVITIWLAKHKIKTNFIVFPMIIMFVITLCALILLIIRYQISLIGIIALILFILAIALALEGYQVVTNKIKIQ